MRKLNSEYKLGQLLCKSRQPDFLLNLIKRQVKMVSNVVFFLLLISNIEQIEFSIVAAMAFIVDRVEFE